MVDEIEQHAKDFGVPLLHLNTDEHTGEAGFITRLEAFADMLLRKKRQKLKNIEPEKDDLSQTEKQKILLSVK